MIERRFVLAGGAALVLSPLGVHAAPDLPLVLNGSKEQGGLVVGRTTPGAKVAVDGKAVSVSPEGLFAFGYNYDQTQAAHIHIEYPDGTKLNQDTAPAVRQYEVQAVNHLPDQEAHPTEPDIVARVAREHAKVAAARNADSAMTFFAEPLDWPAKGIISGLFGSQRILNGMPSAPHMGVDIAGGEGAPIHAPAGGIVLIADQFFLEGGYTLLDHGHGVFTGYMHQSVQLVKPGDGVQRGQQIGNIGHTGRATGPHLHWQMNWFQVRLDPSLSARTPAPDKA